MRRVIVNEWMTFDGVVQSAGADDDTVGALGELVQRREGQKSPACRVLGIQASVLARRRP